jgi:hypothetical protein
MMEQSDDDFYVEFNRPRNNLFQDEDGIQPMDDNDDDIVDNDIVDNDIEFIDFIGDDDDDGDNDDDGIENLDDKSKEHLVRILNIIDQYPDIILRPVYVFPLDERDNFKNFIFKDKFYDLLEFNQPSSKDNQTPGNTLLDKLIFLSNAEGYTDFFSESYRLFLQIRKPGSRYSSKDRNAKFIINAITLWIYLTNATEMDQIKNFLNDDETMLTIEEVIDSNYVDNLLIQLDNFMSLFSYWKEKNVDVAKEMVEVVNLLKQAGIDFPYYHQIFFVDLVPDKYSLQTIRDAILDDLRVTKEEKSYFYSSLTKDLLSLYEKYFGSDFIHAVIQKAPLKIDEIYDIDVFASLMQNNAFMDKKFFSILIDGHQSQKNELHKRVAQYMRYFDQLPFPKKIAFLQDLRKNFPTIAKMNNNRSIERAFYDPTNVNREDLTARFLTLLGYNWTILVPNFFSYQRELYSYYMQLLQWIFQRDYHDKRRPENINLYLMLTQMLIRNCEKNTYDKSFLIAIHDTAYDYLHIPTTTALWRMNVNSLCHFVANELNLLLNPHKSINEELVNAIMADDINKVNEILKTNIHIGDIDEEVEYKFILGGMGYEKDYRSVSLSPLKAALLRSPFYIIKDLVKSKGANLFHISTNGKDAKTPIFYAIVHIKDDDRLRELMKFLPSLLKSKEEKSRLDNEVKSALWYLHIKSNDISDISTEPTQEEI